MISVFKSEKAKEAVLASYDQLVEGWGVQAKAHNVPTRFGDTYCLTAGETNLPPLVLLHGVGDNSAVMWALNMTALSQRYYCIAVDTLGGPGRSVPNEAYRKGSFSRAEWLSEVLQYFGQESVYIAGVSNGAYMAFQYTAAHPERVKKAVCLEGGIVTSPIKSMLSTLLLMFPEMLIPTERNLHRIVRKLSSPHSDVFQQHPYLAEHLVLLMKSHNQKAMFPHPIERYEERKGLAVRDKLLFLLGDERKVVGKDVVSLLEQGQYTFKIIPKAGHGINHEQPEAVHRELFQFLA